MRLSLFSLALSAPLLLGLAACGSSTYCQSGPKHGTQCHSENDLQAPGERPPPAGEDKLNRR